MPKPGHTMLSHMSSDGSTFLQAVRPALEKGDARELARVVAKGWSAESLCGFLQHPNVDVRRVAAVALGLVGDRKVVACLSLALRDIDEQVNQMAEHGLWAIWFRGCSLKAIKPFRDGTTMLGKEAYQTAIECFREAARIDPEFAEAYNQCAIAHFFLAQWNESIEACQRAIAVMPPHFGAICGMGHCYTQLGDLQKALGCYRKALKINPRMPAIVKACERIEQRMREANDSSGMFLAGQAL
jgi:tetratricopeptide (TPR) repeat protein